MKYTKLYLITLLGIIAFFGCAEQRSDLTEPQEVAIHADGALKPSSENFHGNWVRDDNWNLAGCANCHGGDYNGGRTPQSCLPCHTNQNGPEACNTCHGDFHDVTKIAPPQGTNNERNTSDRAVGAHQLHLHEIQIAENTSCTECHTVPSNFEADGHIDGTDGAELNFGTFADGGPNTASYDYASISCQNIYCHGNFEFLASDSPYDFAYDSVKISGNNFSPVWNQVDGTQGSCGTCHGIVDSTGVLITALPTGHYGKEDFDLNDCFNCHGSVVNQAGEIIDPTLHINGEKNVFGN